MTQCMKNSDKSPLDKLIEHSIVISRLKSFLNQIRIARLVLLRIPHPLPSEEQWIKSSKHLEIEASHRIDERNKLCKVYLSSLINPEEYNFKDKFYFSTNELRDGYVLLSRDISKGTDKILFLGNSINFKKGDLISWNKGEKDLPTVESPLNVADTKLHFLTNIIRNESGVNKNR